MHLLCLRPSVHEQNAVSAETINALPSVPLTTSFLGGSPELSLQHGETGRKIFRGACEIAGQENAVRGVQLGLVASRTAGGTGVHAKSQWV